MCARNSCGVRGRRRLGERAADIDSGVIVGSADGGAAVGLDVDERRKVQLFGARPVAGLPDREELSQASAVASHQRRADRVEGVGEGRADRVAVQVLGAGLDVVVVGLQPLVVGLGDAEAEDVDGLRLAAEADGQLLGDERVGPVGQLERAGDRVVVGDGHEVHALGLGQVVDLLRRGGALGQVQRALDAELGELGGGRVDVEIDATVLGHGLQLGRAVPEAREEDAESL